MALRCFCWMWMVCEKDIAFAKSNRRLTAPLRLMVVLRMRLRNISWSVRCVTEMCFLFELFMQRSCKESTSVYDYITLHPYSSYPYISAYCYRLVSLDLSYVRLQATNRASAHAPNIPGLIPKAYFRDWEHHGGASSVYIEVPRGTPRRPLHHWIYIITPVYTSYTIYTRAQMARSHQLRRAQLDL